METKTPTGMLAQLLVATDGTETGDRAVSYAIAIAQRYGSKLIFCCAVDQAMAAAECSAANGGLDFLQFTQALSESARAILAAAQKRADAAGVTATTVQLEGRPADTIVVCANERQVNAIVMGTQGKHGLERVFIGSTAEDVLRHTDIPTFVVPPGASDTVPAFDRILLALDNSEPSEAAAAFAHDLALAMRADLVFCSIADMNSVTAMAATYGYDPTPLATDLHTAADALVASHVDQARHADIACETVVAEGDPAREIVKIAQDVHAPLIVVGTHGRRGLRRFVAGSIAEAVVRNSRVPVAVVRASTTHNALAPEPALTVQPTVAAPALH